MVQLSLNLTEPNVTSFDQVYEFVRGVLDEEAVFILETELIGVIRPRDLDGATQLTYDPCQVVR